MKMLVKNPTRPRGFGVLGFRVSLCLAGWMVHESRVQRRDTALFKGPRCSTWSQQGLDVSGLAGVLWQGLFRPLLLLPSPGPEEVRCHHGRASV